MTTTTEIANVVVRPQLPAEVVVVTAEVQAQVAELVAASAMAVDGPEALTIANDTFVRISALAKSIEGSRLDLTRPIDALKATIIEAQRAATEPLKTAKDSLGRKIVACQAELHRQREEAERKAREEAEAKARAERERLEAERQAEIKRQQEEHARKLKEAEEEARLFGTEPEPVAAPPEPPPVVVVPEVIPPDVSIPALPKAAATTAKRMKLVIDDEAKIPVEVAGRRILVPDEKAIAQLLKAGVAIPGCRLVEEVSVRATGGRR